METEATQQRAQEETKQPDSADLVIGILTELDPDSVVTMCDALRKLPGPLRIAVLQNDDRKGPVPASAEGEQNNATVFFPSSVLAKPNGSATGLLSMVATYQSVFAAGEKFQSRACCILASKLESPPPEWACGFARPLLEQNIDLVVPRYARRRFEGLLNSAVISPLMRSLYGRRLHNPMGPDVGISRRLFEKLLGTARSTKAGGNGIHPLASLAPSAVCENLHVAELQLGTRAYPAPDWTNTSSLLADALSPVFLDMERNSSCWQRTRTSTAVPAVGEAFSVQEDPGTVDTKRLVDSFALGYRELQEIWSLVLPPYTLFELRKLSRQPAEQFRMADELWVRIVYDFALAHRLRMINRDHLLKSMTPLYLGWVASYARALQDDATLPDQNLERLAQAFESQRAYLVSRWRWPDRFNP
jgi:glucosylglycerate synthase